MVDMTARGMAQKNAKDISDVALGAVSDNSITDAKLSNTGIKATVSQNVQDIENKVDKTISINGHTLGSNININANDIVSGTMTPSVLPIATSNITGTTKIGNGLNVDVTGLTTTRLGIGLKFDGSYNIVPDVGNIDVTSLKNFSSIVTGAPKGFFDNTATLTTLANGTKGDFWIYNGTAGFVLGGQTFNTRDQLWITTTFVGAPVNLTTNFQYVANTISQATTASFGTVKLGSVTPLSDSSTPSIGTSQGSAREDHIHPSDTSKANSGDLGTVSTLTTASKIAVGAINEVSSILNTTNSNIGTTSNLTTANKTSLVNAINENVSNMKSKLDTSRHFLTYKNLSMHVGLGGTSVPLASMFSHFALQGVDATFIIPVNIVSLTDPAPTMFADSVITQSLANAQSVGVKTTQIKLHIGMNFGDGTNRAGYIPDAPTFFPNWQAICLHYAQICVNNGIAVLCIGCEQSQQSINANFGYWQTIVTAIRTQYPTLLITYAANGAEQMVSNPLSFWSLFDFIGFNMYFTYTNLLVSQNPTKDSLIQSFYNIPTGNTTMDQINFYANLYNKQIYITETGLQPADSGLAIDYDSMLVNPPITYDGQALAIEACCDGIFQNANIIGFSWWSALKPFNYFVDGSITSAEQAMINYVKGGLI